MKIRKFDNQISKFQEGGQIPDQQMGAPEQEQDPIMQIAQIAMQALETQDCEAAMGVCEAFLMLVQQMSGNAEPVGSPQGEPVFKKGGKITKKIKKNENGGLSMKNKKDGIIIDKTKIKVK